MKKFKLLLVATIILLTTSCAMQYEARFPVNKKEMQDGTNGVKALTTLDSLESALANKGIYFLKKNHYGIITTKVNYDNHNSIVRYQIEKYDDREYLIKAIEEKYNDYYNKFDEDVIIYYEDGRYQIETGNYRYYKDRPQIIISYICTILNSYEIEWKFHRAWK